MSLMKFLLDHCVPASVGAVLRERGHDVVILTDVLPQDAADQIVAKVAELNDCVLVTQDSDFKKIANRIPDGAKDRVRKLSRIALQCETPRCATRTRLALAFIEFEWRVCLESADPRMFLTIGDRSMRTAR